MEINKQLFEDVLSGKLKGTFVLRNKSTLHSSNLRKITGTKYQYVLCSHSYTSEGMLISNNKTHPLNIEDFIPEINMKENELKITIPEGQEIDWQESAKQEKIVFKKKEVFKKKDTKPKSWDEYLELNTGFDGAGIDWNCGGVQTTGLHHRGKAIVPTHLAQPFIAMMQLMSLRQAWIGDWKPDWSCGYSSNYCIIGSGDSFEMCILSKCRYALSFPTKEMAIDFMNCFKDLLEIAKPLI